MGACTARVMIMVMEEWAANDRSQTRVWIVVWDVEPAYPRLLCLGSAKLRAVEKETCSPCVGRGEMLTEKVVVKGNETRSVGALSHIINA